MTPKEKNRILIVTAIALMVGGLILMWPVLFSSLGTETEVEAVPTTQVVPAAPATVTVAAPTQPVIPLKQALQTRVGWEEDRLKQLKVAYADVNSRQINANFVKRQVTTLSARLKETQDAIAKREEEKARVDEEMQAAQRRSKMNSNDQQISLENQIAAINAQIVAIQEQTRQAGQAAAAAAATPPNPTPTVAPSTTPVPTIYNANGMTGVTYQQVPVNPATGAPVMGGAASSATPAPTTSSPPDVQAQIAALEVQRGQLMAQLRTTELSAENATIAAAENALDDKTAIRTEQQNLARLQADLAKELEYWQQQQQAIGDEKLRVERLKSIQNELRQQEMQVSKLRQELGTYR